MSEDEGGGILVEIKAALGLISRGYEDTRRAIQAFQYSVFRPVTVPTFAVPTTGPSVIPIATAQMGWYSMVRQVRVTGVNMTAVTGVNVDLYVTSRQAIVTPPVSDWRGSSGTTASNPGLPVLLALGTRELPVHPGEWLTVVLSGTGVVAGAQFQVSATLEDMQGFAGLIRTGESL